MRGDHGIRRDNGVSRHSLEAQVRLRSGPTPEIRARPIEARRIRRCERAAGLANPAIHAVGRNKPIETERLLKPNDVGLPRIELRQSRSVRASIHKQTLDNSRHATGQRLVFPEPQYIPPCPLQCDIRIAVAPSVRFDLLAPKLAISLRPSPVSGASMPETAVNENR